MFSKGEDSDGITTSCFLDSQWSAESVSLFFLFLILKNTTVLFLQGFVNSANIKFSKSSALWVRFG